MHRYGHVLSRRDFLKTTAIVTGTAAFDDVYRASAAAAAGGTVDALFQRFVDPPREYTLMPFWFLNDDLDPAELRRQLDDFAAHGVYGVVPHARIGLPRNLAFMSDSWLNMLEVCIEHAAQRDMLIILYDEGMYPSGSCAGQVAAANPLHATRCLERRTRPRLEPGETLVYRDDAYCYVNTPSLGRIRGVHFGMDDGEAGAPASADILNPEAVASFLHLTHDKHYERFGAHFGNTIIAIFTDEPDTLGRGHKRNVKPWTWEFDAYIASFLGYDFKPHLRALWDTDAPDAEQHRRAFAHAVNARLEESYYRPYHDWCEAHHIALTGHPAGSMDIGTLKYFHIPGQDVVWRYLEPYKNKSLEGEHATMGKCSSSAKENHGRARNLNECFGAYGWEFTWEEMRWLTDWLLVRGVDMLSPHAFYYSIRGPRRNERPPDVGPNNVWWDRYKPYADYCRRISWLNAAGDHVCDVAILGTPVFLPWRAARALFEGQRDFNYLDTDTLCEKARVDASGVTVGAKHYTVAIVDGTDILDTESRKLLKPLLDAGRVLAYPEPIAGIDTVASDADALLARLDKLTPADVRLRPANPDIRYRHLVVNGIHLYFFTNEGSDTVDTALSVSVSGKAVWWEPYTSAVLEDVSPENLSLAPGQSRVLCVCS